LIYPIVLNIQYL